MRKLLYTFAALASMLAVAASCQRETPEGRLPDGDLIDVSMNFTVDDGRPATKAIGDGTTASVLTFYAYDEHGNYLYTLSSSATISYNASSLAGTVSLKVVKGMKYQFVMLATAPSAIGSYYTVDAANKTLAVNYSSIATAQKEDSDFFYFKSGVTSFTASGESKTATLKRPLAQLNVGSTAEDFAVATNSGINTNTMQTGYVLTGIPNQLSLLDGNVNVSGTENNITLAPATRPLSDLTVGSDTYKWVSTAYVLMSVEGQTTDVTLNVTMTNNQEPAQTLSPISRSITAVPLKRNYRTNILGNIFSIDAMFNVSVDSDFTDNTNKIIGPSYASVAELNSYFATFANNADNGNVDPEVVTLTDIPEASPEITLPKYTGIVQIRITKAYDGTLNLKYADSAADKPEKVELYTASLKNLTTDIEASHLSILPGSVITEGTFATGSSTLEIMVGAKVGTANIQKGNVEIAGEVDKVEVKSAATADGTNPVQVFVAKEAAIQQIELNAQSDVVVEQPKDNIDVSASDNKIVVTINVAGSSATAQNGGEIYVVANVDTQVVASGEGSTVVVDTNNSDSSIPIAVDCLNNTEDSSAISVVEGKGEDVVINNFIAKVDGVPADSEKTISQILAEATAGQTVTIYKAGTYTLPNLKNITVEAAEGAEVVFSHTGNGNICSVPDGATFKNVSFTFGNNNYHGWQHAGKIVMEGCTLNGKLFSYGDMEFKNCTFNQTIEEYHMWCYSGNLSYKDCTFEGSGKFLNIYNEDNTGMPWILTFDGCEFSSTVSNKAALNIKATCGNKALKYNVTIKDCTVNENFPEAGVKSSALVVIAPVVQVDDLAVNVVSDITIDLDGTVYTVKNGKVCLGDDALVGPGVTQDVTSGTYKVVNAEGFNYVLSSSAILKPASKNVTIALENDIDLTDSAAHTAQNLSGASYVVTLDGQGHSVKGLKEELFTEAVNGAVVNVKNMTFEEVNINKSDDQYVAVVMGYADCNGGINVSNVTFKDITLVGKKHIGVVYGFGSGWDKQSDGPVFMDSTIEACEFDNCQLTTTEGSAGVVAGHVAGNAWTLLTLKNSTVKNCKVTCGESNKAGVLFGTIGVAGTQAYGKTGGTYVVDSFWYDNTVTANGDAVERSFGRVGSAGGKYYIDGVLVASKVGDEAEVVSGDIYEKRP